jgi:hypothetical protein
MASTNHTARPNPLVPPQPKRKSTSSFDDPPPPAGVKQERRSSDTPQWARAALAVAVMEGMLKTHHAIKQAKPEGKRKRVLPLNPVQLIGLEAAIDLLHHDVDTLSPQMTG